MAHTRELDPAEARIVGVLMEKERATPDQYPLTVNALLQGCNQKTNREPVTELSETEVVEALDRLRADVLVWRVEGSRSERWKHCLDRRWHLDTAASVAVMALLLLRGAQTTAELRARAERLHPFTSVDEVEATLRRLAEGPDALVRELPRRPGQRETRWIHLAGKAEPRGATSPTLEESTAERAPERPLPGDRPSGSALADRVASLEAAVADLTATLRDLQARLGD